MGKIFPNGLLLLFFSWVKERKEQLAERLADMEGEPT